MSDNPLLCRMGRWGYSGVCTHNGKQKWKWTFKASLKYVRQRKGFPWVCFIYHKCLIPIRRAPLPKQIRSTVPENQNPVLRHLMKCLCDYRNLTLLYQRRRVARSMDSSDAETLCPIGSSYLHGINLLRRWERPRLCPSVVFSKSEWLVNDRISLLHMQLTVQTAAFSCPEVCTNAPSMQLLLLKSRCRGQWPLIAVR